MYYHANANSFAKLTQRYAKVTGRWLVSVREKRQLLTPLSLPPSSRSSYQEPRCSQRSRWRTGSMRSTLMYLSRRISIPIDVHMSLRQNRTIIFRGYTSPRDESTVTDRHAPLNPNRLGRSPIPRELAGGLSLSRSHVAARARPAYVIRGCVQAEPIPGSFSEVVS